MEAPELWKLVEQVVPDPDGGEQRRPTPVTEFSVIGSGYPLTSYRPTMQERMRQFVIWSFTPTTDRESSAVAEVRDAVLHDRDMFPIGPVDRDMGWASWRWSTMPAIKQKLVLTYKCDPASNIL